MCVCVKCTFGLALWLIVVFTTDIFQAVYNRCSLMTLMGMGKSKMGSVLNFGEHQEWEVSIPMAGILQTRLPGGSYLPICSEHVHFLRYPCSNYRCAYLGTGSPVWLWIGTGAVWKAILPWSAMRNRIFSHRQLFDFGLCGSSETCNLFIQFKIRGQCNSQWLSLLFHYGVLIHCFCGHRSIAGLIWCFSAL